MTLIINERRARSLLGIPVTTPKEGEAFIEAGHYYFIIIRNPPNKTRADHNAPST